MKATRHNRGSVLMEFIIVFPIYLVLFGGVFMIGDMLVHATRLASAERTVSFDLQTGNAVGWNAIKDKLFHISGSNPEITDNRESQDSLSMEKESVWYADTEVDHPWSLRAACTILDQYKLPVGGTAGRLLSAANFLGSVGVLDQSEVSSSFMGLISGTAVNIHSKDVGSEKEPRKYTYNYYTLKKTRYRGKTDDGKVFYTWRDNRRHPSDLVAHSEVKHAWRSQVKEEKYHETVKDYDSNRKKDTYRRPERADYQRYAQFVEWSE